MKKEYLNKILTDKTSGSVELIRKINNYFIKHYDNKALILKSIGRLKSTLKTFQAVQIYLNKIKTLLNNNDSLLLKNYLFDYHSRNEVIFQNIYSNLKSSLKNRNKIFTLSNSQTVYEVLKLLRREKKELEVIVSESRPKLEGRILAKKLLKIGINVELIADDNLPKSISTCEAVLIGADKILKNGSVVNKIGSLTAAILAKYYIKPFFVVASRDKFSKDEDFKLVKQNPNEIWKLKNPNLQIENYYFEIVPQKLITKIVTDK